MTDHRVLVAGVAPANEFRIVEVLQEADDEVLVRGDLPGGRDELSISADSNYDLRQVSDACDDLEVGHYVASQDGEEIVVRDLSECGLFATIYEAPEVQRVPAQALGGGR